MMSTTRRTALAMLGLAPATAAVGSEQFMAAPKKPGEIQSVFGAYTAEDFAGAFENLARNIRAGSVDVDRLRFVSDLSADKIADCHELTLNFRYKPEV